MAAPAGGLRIAGTLTGSRAVRQGELGPPGKWTGTPHSGVAAPDPLILPDPAKRFAATARRLETIATGAPLEAWLRFMAQIGWAQHEAVAVLSRTPALDSDSIAAAVAERQPPLAADRHALDPGWQRALGSILECFDAVALPDEARSVIADLEGRDAQGLDALAHAFLRDAVEPDEIGPALYVAAALQVQFTVLAAALAAESLRLLPQRGLCPCCGSTSVTGLVTASGRSPGCRYLYCSLCSTAWNHVRAVCITCGESGALSLKSIEGDNGAVKAETCGKCRTYAKLLYEAKDTKVDPFADDLATLALDVLVAEAGWSRHAPNPLFLTA
jgi:FdhE protein